MSSNEIFALRKQGRSAEALEMARAELPENANDVWFLRAYAWSIYDHAKSVVEAYESKELSPNALTAKLTPYMREFSRMATPLRGDTTFSQMLRLAGKASKDWQEFMAFARWAGVDDFSADDEKPFVNDQGKTIDSLKKRFVRAICRETAARADDPQADQGLVDWGKGILQQALEDDPNDQWLNYYLSKLHLASGESEEAIKRLTPVLRRQARAAWPWALLGEVLEATQPADALACYAHAVQLAREEQEVAKVRIRLAERLALADRYDEAARQASLALAYREQHGYRVPQELAQLLASDWYKQAVESDSLRELPDFGAEAQAIVRKLDRQSLIYTQGVIDHINADKALSFVATSVDAGCGLAHRRFPRIADLPPGTLVEIGRAEPDGPPIDWRLSEADSLPGLCETLSGSLERHDGKEFAFIRTGGDDVFVPPPLAAQFAQGQQYQVSCVAVRRANKQGKVGWRAVKLVEEEPLEG
mgnify:CR=1 FL=1